MRKPRSVLTTLPVLHRMVRYMIVAGIAVAGGITIAGPVQGQVRQRWITTWGASVTPVPTQNVQVLVSQTLRQVVIASVGGSVARVRISNEWGERPLTIGSAYIALADTGASTVAASGRGLTFGGSPSIVVQPGSTIFSDPMEFTVPPLTAIAVSLHLPDTTFGSTLAIAGGQRSYASPTGNFAAAGSMPVAAVRVGWLFLAGLDVVNEHARGAIVAFGSSITGGGNSASPGGRWPDILARRLQASPESAHYAVVVSTISGNRLLGGGRGTPLLSRFERDVLGHSGVSHVVIAEGLNDISFAATEGGGKVTAADVVLALTQLAQRARERGLIVIGGTLTPFGGSNYGAPLRNHGPAEEAMRAAVNAWIRSSGVFDAVIDFDACVRDPQRHVQLFPPYDSGDHLHPNDAGFRALGECIDLGIFHRRGSIPELLLLERITTTSKTSPWRTHVVRRQHTRLPSKMLSS